MNATTQSSGGGGGGGGGGGSGLPAHLLMGYWQDFTNGATPLTLADVPASYNLVAVAFGTATSTPGQVAFSLDPTLASDLGGYTQQQFTSDIATLHSRGPSVIHDALDCLAAQANCGSFVPPAAYPAIRGVMTWSINWDASNGYNFADTVAPYPATLP